jgi:hypothetical protein
MLHNAFLIKVCETCGEAGHEADDCGEE